MPNEKKYFPPDNEIEAEPSSASDYEIFRELFPERDMDAHFLSILTRLYTDCAKDLAAEINASGDLHKLSKTEALSLHLMIDFYAKWGPILPKEIKSKEQS